MSSILIRTAVLVLLLAVLGLGTGLLFGPGWGWLLFSLGLIGLIVHHVRHLRLLGQWASRSLSEAVPEGKGVWEEVFTLLYRRQRAETARSRQLAHSLARSRQAGRALPYGVAILDAEYRIVWCNDSCEAHFGIDAEADVGQPITNLVRQPEFVEYVAAEEFSKPLQLKTTRDGLVLSVQFVPYVDSQRLLRSRDYMNLMSEQSRRMQRIIDDLLTLSTLESAPEPPHDEHVDVALLLSRIHSEAQALSGGRQRITLDAEPGFDLLGAESEIASAFGNLASNAVRYTPPGGEVRLIWRGSQKGAEFAVEDTGVGIEAEHIPRLTERFYRVDRGRSRETGGTGLGLAIVKHALARHQATLEIESTPGTGSRFTARACLT